MGTDSLRFPTKAITATHKFFLFFMPSGESFYQIYYMDKNYTACNFQPANSIGCNFKSCYAFDLAYMYVIACAQVLTENCVCMFCLATLINMSSVCRSVQKFQ